MRNKVNRMDRPHRSPVGVSRTLVPYKVAERGARLIVARLACGVEGYVRGRTHGHSLARSASSLSALSNLLVIDASKSGGVPGTDANRRARRFTGSMIAGGVYRGLPGETLKLTYETYIHLQN
jgi:hypothetical protein